MHLCENIIPSFARFALDLNKPLSTVQKVIQVTTYTKFLVRAKFQIRSDGFKQVPTRLFSHLCRDFI